MRALIGSVGFVLVIAAMLFFATSCSKLNEAPEPQFLTKSAPLINRNNDTIGLATISGAENGPATVNFQFRSNAFGPAFSSYEAGLYNGATGSYLYAELARVNANPASWTTFPVREYSTGRIIPVNEILDGQVLRATVIDLGGQETVGIARFT